MSSAFLVILLSLSIASSWGSDFVFKKGQDFSNIVKLLSQAMEPGTYFCTEDFRKIKLKHCEEREPEVLSLMEGAHRRLQRMRTEAKSYQTKKDLTSNKILRRRLKRIEKRLACIQKRIQDISIICVPKEIRDSDAFVRPMYFFNLVPMFYTDEVYFTPSFWLRSSDYKESVIIHEISHLCGARDIQDLVGPNGRISSPVEEDKEADNYQLWSLKSFCLPGLDC